MSYNVKLVANADDSFALSISDREEKRVNLNSKGERERKIQDFWYLDGWLAGWKLFHQMNKNERARHKMASNHNKL